MGTAQRMFQAPILLITLTLLVVSLVADNAKSNLFEYKDKTKK